MTLTWGMREVLRYALRHEGRTRITSHTMAEKLVNAGFVVPTDEAKVYQITPIGRAAVGSVFMSRIYVRLFRFIRSEQYELIRLRDGREEFVLWPLDDELPIRMARGAARAARKRLVVPVGTSDIGDVYALTERGHALLEKATVTEEHHSNDIEHTTPGYD